MIKFQFREKVSEIIFLVVSRLSGQIFRTAKIIRGKSQKSKQNNISELIVRFLCRILESQKYLTVNRKKSAK